MATINMRMPLIATPDRPIHGETRADPKHFASFARAMAVITAAVLDTPMHRE
jgi:hypothetical protein